MKLHPENITSEVKKTLMNRRTVRIPKLAHMFDFFFLLYFYLPFEKKKGKNTQQMFNWSPTGNLSVKYFLFTQIVKKELQMRVETFKAKRV